MNEVRVQGRGIKRPRALIYENGAAEVCIRIDDDANPEFWLAVHIPRSLLLTLLTDAVDLTAPEGGAL